MADVEHGDVRASCRPRSDGVAHRAAANDRGHIAGATPGTPPMRMLRPPKRFLQVEGAHLRRHAPGDPAHGWRSGKLAVGRLYCLVGDARDLVRPARVRAAVGGQMQIGEDGSRSGRRWRYSALRPLTLTTIGPGAGRVGHDFGARDAHSPSWIGAAPARRRFRPARRLRRVMRRTALAVRPTRLSLSL